MANDNKPNKSFLIITLTYVFSHGKQGVQIIVQKKHATGVKLVISDLSLPVARPNCFNMAPQFHHMHHFKKVLDRTFGPWNKGVSGSCDIFNGETC